MDAKGENRKEKANCFAFLGLKPKALCFSIAEGIDNIAIERFSGNIFASQKAILLFLRSVKTERIYLQEYNSIKELKQDLSNYINFYNY